MMELQDKIGREELVNKIKYLIETLPENEHFCLALDGEWGSGKSFVIKMLQDKFCNYTNEYIIVNYDAWKNNFYSDPLIAILFCVLDSIPKQDIKSKNFKLVYRAVKQVAKDKLAKGFDSLIDELYNKGGWLQVCAFAMEAIKLIVKQANSSVLDNKLFDNYKSYQSLLNESVSILNALTARKTDDGKQRRLIVLVDEIDRCLPDDQLIVLERLHHLFDVKNCAVIVALNKTAICETFNNQFGGNGKEYLRKFFNYNFKMLANADIYLKNSLWDNIVESSEYHVFNAISTEQIDYLQRTIFNVLKNEFSDTIKIDNRTLDNLLRHTYNIAVNLPDNKIDFSYLFIIVWSVCLKLYDKKRYYQILNLASKAKFYYDIVDRTVIYSGLSSLRQVVLANNYYEIYRDLNINTINFYINMWRANGNKDIVSGLKRIFEHDILVDPNYENVLKYIFDAVDGISDSLTT